MVVLGVMALASAIVLPSFAGALAESRLRAGARGLLAQCRYARDLAVRRGTYARVEIDPVNGSHAVSVLDTDPQTGERKWVSDTHPLGQPHRLPERVSFDRLIAASETGDEAVTFSPDGRGEDWLVSIRDERDRRLAVRVAAVTGTAEVLSPDDYETLEEMFARAEDRR